MRHYRPWLVEFALEVLERHSQLRYERCHRPQTKRRALVGQAEGLVRHDRILIGSPL